MVDKISLPLPEVHASVMLRDELFCLASHVPV